MESKQNESDQSQWNMKLYNLITKNNAIVESAKLDFQESLAQTSDPKAKERLYLAHIHVLYKSIETINKSVSQILGADPK